MELIAIPALPVDNSFKSQQEIWQHLVEGGKVQNIVGKNLYYFKDGRLSPGSPLHFTKPSVWQKYEPKVVPFREWKEDVTYKNKQLGSLKLKDNRVWAYVGSSKWIESNHSVNDIVGNHFHEVEK